MAGPGLAMIERDNRKVLVDGATGMSRPRDCSKSRVMDVGAASSMKLVNMQDGRGYERVVVA